MHSRQSGYPYTGTENGTWGGRFKSQALLDEAGLLTAMAYVDLNPIRAGIAKTPEDSEFTSIYDRIRVIKRVDDRTPSAKTKVPLLQFKDAAEKGAPSIPFSLFDYLALVDWTGRARREDKRGAIEQTLPPILKRLKHRCTGVSGCDAAARESRGLLEDSCCSITGTFSVRT